MRLWRHEVLPRLIDVVMRGDSISVWRRRCLVGVQGVVVEPGFGSGLNLPHMPPEVTTVYAIDPAVLGQKLAAGRVAESGIEVEFVGLDGQTLPLADNSCDAGVLTYTLCSIPDPHQALAELRRVIKPGGTLHFVEHGEAPDERVRRWQLWVAPIQKRVADGCHLNRPIVQLISDAGFDILWTDARYHGRPKVGTHFTAGVAANPLLDA
jgi:ubiquinone/menaquinone biosynthesis C-methylase UbiE